MADRFEVVGHSLRRVDGHALATGAPVFTDDVPVLPGTLHLAMATSPHAHARIRGIDTAAAGAVDGVALILTHQNTPETHYTTAGQGYPEPSPYDTRMFNDVVRYVGDRVAVVAADTPQAARDAAAALRVDYEVLSPVLSIDESLADGAPVVHAEPGLDVCDAGRNVVAHVEAVAGDVEAALADAAVSVVAQVESQYAQHVPLEPHAVATHLDADGRLVVVTSTQVPFHVRRILARVLDLPLHRIRVIKPRIGGGFGVKQELLLEDVAALVTVRTGRPARWVFTREEELVSARTRHPYRVRVALGAADDGVLTAVDMQAWANTGAYGAHALTVLSNVGSKCLPLYNKAPNVRFLGDAVYTNLPVAGAYRGYGATQGYFALETAMDALAERLGMDPVELRRRNHIRAGETSPIFRELGEGREGVDQIVPSCELEQCLTVGAERFGWDDRRGRRERHGAWVHGVGMSVSMQGSGIPMVDMGAATLSMNDDGSFLLAVGATDLGTGSDTILGQIAAEVLGVPLAAVVVRSSDTDTTPFDVGAYASSTTYVSGTAVRKAAEQVRDQIAEVGAAILRCAPSEAVVADGRVTAPDGSSATLEQVGLRTLYGVDQHQIAATASHVPELSAPPFMAAFVEVAVDTETGQVRVVDVVAAVDCGVPINPRLAEGQVEGALANGIGYALMEELVFDEQGRCRTTDLGRYKIPSTLDLPPLRVVLVDSFDPTGPLGAKSVAEIGINAPLPAIANAIHDAVGVRLTDAPFTAEKVWRAMHAAGA